MSVFDERSLAINLVLKSVPPLIRESLLSKRSFRNEYALKFGAIIVFENNDVSIHSSVLFDAIRIVLVGEDPIEIIDTEDRTWTLTVEVCDGDLPKLVLSSDQQRLVLPDFSVLAGDVSTRIRSLEESASDVNLPPSAHEEWRSILEERTLEDDEVDTFHSDIRDTPIHVGRTIRREITAGKCTVSSLVPNSRRYFERLVGVYDGSASIKDYAAGVGREVFKQLTEWRPYEGFLFSLFLSSHCVLTAEINTDHLSQEELEKSFDHIEKHGDMLSRLGAVEVGLRILPDRPEVEHFLLRLIHRIRDDDVKSKASEFRLFSSLFVLVDGELARSRLLAKEPPFYRRLASLAHAALIQRQLVQCGVDYDSFSEWASSNRGNYFYMQSFADMCIEPRWNSDLVDASQMQADFFGRIMNAGNNFQANIGNGELSDTILGDGKQSLIKLCEFPRPYFPGPLEGAEDNLSALPDDIAPRLLLLSIM